MLHSKRTICGVVLTQLCCHIQYLTWGRGRSATINDLHPSANGLHFQQFLCGASDRLFFTLRNFLQRKTAQLHWRTGGLPGQNLSQAPLLPLIKPPAATDCEAGEERSDTFKQNFRLEPLRTWKHPARLQ